MTNSKNGLSCEKVIVGGLFILLSLVHAEA
jgi:hypothetical protein